MQNERSQKRPHTDSNERVVLNSYLLNVISHRNRATPSLVLRMRVTTIEIYWPLSVSKWTITPMPAGTNRRNIPRTGPGMGSESVWTPTSPISWKIRRAVIPLRKDTGSRIDDRGFKGRVTPAVRSPAWCPSRKSVSRFRLRRRCRHRFAGASPLLRSRQGEGSR